MKSALPEIKTTSMAVLLFAACMYSSLAQTNGDVVMPKSEPMDQIRTQFAGFETNAFEIETNKLLEPGKRLDETMAAMWNSLEYTVVCLKDNQLRLDRKQQTVLWFEFLAAIDRHYVPNYFTTNRPIDIGGWISPPPGYKGKVGPFGMEPPDTNDLEMSSYYASAVKADWERLKKSNYQISLKRINADASERVERFLKSAYTASESDQNELNEILDQSSLSTERKQKLRSFIVNK